MATHKPIEAYQEMQETFSPRLKADVADTARDMTDNFLMMFGEPKEYADLRAMTATACDGLLLWLVTEGYVTLDPSWVITDEESAEREVERATRTVKRENHAHGVPGFPGGQYL